MHKFYRVLLGHCFAKNDKNASTKVGLSRDPLATPSNCLYKVSLTKNCDSFVVNCSNCLNLILLKPSNVSISFKKLLIQISMVSSMGAFLINEFASQFAINK